MHLLEIKDLTKRFGGLTAVKDVSFNVDADAFRFGISMNLPYKIIASLDEMLTVGTIAGSVQDYDPATAGHTAMKNVSLSFMRSETVLMLGAQFGRYIAVKAYDGVGNLSANYSNEISGWPRPTLATAFPSVAEQGRQLDVVFTGTNFQNGATLSFTEPGITVNSINVSSCGQLVANLTVAASSAPGAVSVDAVNPDMTFGTGVGLFTVEALKGDS